MHQTEGTDRDPQTQPTASGGSDTGSPPRPKPAGLGPTLRPAGKPDPDTGGSGGTKVGLGPTKRVG